MALHGLYDGRLRLRAAVLWLTVAAANAAAWLWAWAMFHGSPVLLGTALLAYGFGLRHAVDADHIAAIDNVTRKLMADGRRPLAVGLYFSGGHAAVVALASLLFATAGAALSGVFAALVRVGSIAGPLISTAFLVAIAVSNLAILWAAWRARGDDEIGRLPDGFLMRLLRPVLGLVRHGWQMLLVGALFGLGFDTATEIGVLGLSAGQGAGGLMLAMVFPALFAAGMALIDTADGILMLGAYGWALRAPRFKFAYNIAITLGSAVVALAVAGVELAQVIGDRLELGGAVWRLADKAAANSDSIGLFLIAASATAWFMAWAYFRLRAPR